MNHSSSPKFFSKMDDVGVVFMPAGVFDMFWNRFLLEMSNNDFDSEGDNFVHRPMRQKASFRTEISGAFRGRNKKGALVTETVIDEHGVVKSERLVFSSRPETSFLKHSTEALAEYFSKIPGSQYIPAFLAEMNSSYDEYPNCFFMDDPRSRDRILRRINVTKRRMYQILDAWVKCGFIHKIEKSIYQVNPYLYSKGEFGDTGRLKIAFTLEHDRLKLPETEKTKIAKEYDLCVETDDPSTLELRLHVVVFDDDWEVKVNKEGAIVDVANSQVVGGGGNKDKGEKSYLIARTRFDTRRFYEDDACCLNLN